MAIYEVKSGDTMWAIAQRHNTTVAAICRENNIPLNRADSIFAGQRFNIGTSTVPESIRRPESVQHPVPSPARQPEMPVHIVRPGENLSSIAEKYGITIDELCAANGYDKANAHRLQIGHTFKIDISGRLAREREREVKHQALAAIQPPRTENREEISRVASQIARIHGVDPNLVLAVIQQESEFNPRAVSCAGAVGLMQLMPSTARALGITNCRDVKQNLDGGIRHLKWLLEKYGGNVDRALTAYNWGSANMDAYLAGRITTMPGEARRYAPGVRAKYQAA